MQEKAQLIMWYDGGYCPQITRATLISHPPIGSVDAPLFPVPYVQAVEFTLEANPNLTSSNAHKDIKRHLSMVYHATV